MAKITFGEVKQVEVESNETVTEAVETVAEVEATPVAKIDVRQNAVMSPVAVKKARFEFAAFSRALPQLASLFTLFATTSDSEIRVRDSAEYSSALRNLDECVNGLTLSAEISDSEKALAAAANLGMHYKGMKNKEQTAFPLSFLLGKLELEHHELVKKVLLTAPVRKEEKPEAVFYFKDFNDLVKGTLTETTCGRYLSRVLNLKDVKLDLATQAYKAWSDNEAFRLKKAGNDEAKIWLDIYSSDHIGSCMRRNEAVTVYAAASFGLPDNGLRLAWFGEEPKKAKARAIINEEKKTFVRVYGDDMLKSILKREGYTECTDTVDGCMLPVYQVDKRSKNYEDNCMTVEELQKEYDADGRISLYAPYLDGLSGQKIKQFEDKVVMIATDGCTDIGYSSDGQVRYDASTLMQGLRS